MIGTTKAKKVSDEKFEIPAIDNSGMKRKIPHVGWNQLCSSLEKKWSGGLLSGIEQGASMYFVHSFILEPKQKENVFTLSEYGGHTFASAIKKDNVYGLQFHPEKSAEAGLSVIKNFVNLAEMNGSTS